MRQACNTNTPEPAQTQKHLGTSTVTYFNSYGLVLGITVRSKELEWMIPELDLILMGQFQFKIYYDSMTLFSYIPISLREDMPCLSFWFSYTKQRIRRVGGDKSLDDSSSRMAVAS